MSDEAVAAVYAVRRLPHGNLPEVLAGPVEVAVFADYQAARADCAEREQTARHGVNPFRLWGPHLPAVTSLDAPVLHDWLLDAGLDAPSPNTDGIRDWAGWWDAWQRQWTAGQRDAVWQALDRARFFDVVERRRARRKAYIVVEIGWWWNDDPPLYSDPEGGIPVEAFSDRDLAEVRRLELEAERRQNNWFDSNRFDLEGRGGAQPGEYTLADVPLYEVIEVDWEGP
jgi:hypothetical protein